MIVPLMDSLISFSVSTISSDESTLLPILLVGVGLLFPTPLSKSYKSVI